jgi:hypothetical protein
MHLAARLQAIPIRTRPRPADQPERPRTQLGRVLARLPLPAHHSILPRTGACASPGEGQRADRQVSSVSARRGVATGEVLSCELDRVGGWWPRCWL